MSWLKNRKSIPSAAHTSVVQIKECPPGTSERNSLVLEYKAAVLKTCQLEDFFVMSKEHGTQQAGIGLRILTSTAKYSQHFL